MCLLVGSNVIRRMQYCVIRQHSNKNCCYPFAGVLLSGGLDSSLVAAIAARKLARDGSVWGKLHSFCIGLPGSPDLKAARGVAEFLGTDHHEFTFSVQVGVGVCCACNVSMLAIAMSTK